VAACKWSYLEFCSIAQVRYAVVFMRTLTRLVSEPSTAHYSIRCNQQSKLCWQGPQRKACDQSDYGLTATEVGRYCEELVLGGYAGWRLPDSDELRGIIVGNSMTNRVGNTTRMNCRCRDCRRLNYTRAEAALTVSSP
jgi:hypothetical protein